MNSVEFEKLSHTKNMVLSIDDLVDKSDRTLIYGYTCSRSSWHVYIKNGVIHTLMYDYFINKEFDKVKRVPRNTQSGDISAFTKIDELNVSFLNIKVTDNQGYLPDKRIYPLACDYEFCKLLIKSGCHLPFTGDASGNTPIKKYYGYVDND